MWRRPWATRSPSPRVWTSPRSASCPPCTLPEADPAVHIELTEMLRCPEPHGEAFLVMSTGQMLGRMVRSGILGCPICRREFPIVKGIVNFSGTGKGERGKVDDEGATIPLSPFPFPAAGGGRRLGRGRAALTQPSSAAAVGSAAA